MTPGKDKYLAMKALGEVLNKRFASIKPQEPPTVNVGPTPVPVRVKVEPTPVTVNVDVDPLTAAVVGLTEVVKEFLDESRKVSAEHKKMAGALKEVLERLSKPVVRESRRVTIKHDDGTSSVLTEG